MVNKIAHRAQGSEATLADLQQAVKVFLRMKGSLREKQKILRPFGGPSSVKVAPENYAAAIAAIRKRTCELAPSTCEGANEWTSYAPVPAPASAVASTVDHPKHYNTNPSGVECIDVVEHMPFNIGNAMKYLWRCDDKGDPIENLEKAAWYVQREIAKRKKEIGN